MSSNVHSDLVPILRNVFNELMKMEKNGQASKITKVIRYDTYFCITSCEALASAFFNQPVLQLCVFLFMKIIITEEKVWGFSPSFIFFPPLSLFFHALVIPERFINSYLSLACGTDLVKIFSPFCLPRQLCSPHSSLPTTFWQWCGLNGDQSGFVTTIHVLEKEI